MICVCMTMIECLWSVQLINNYYFQVLLLEMLLFCDCLCIYYRMEDRGDVISIKFSSDMKILAIQRSQKSVVCR
jgi:hypothetical protein